MVSFIRNVSFDCSDPYALAGFWSGVIGHRVHPACVPDDTEVVIEPRDGPRLFFQAVSEGKLVKNRVHVCLQPADRDATWRSIAFSHWARRCWPITVRPMVPGWVVLPDPAGNEFCVTRSSSERRS